MYNNINESEKHNIKLKKNHNPQRNLRVGVGAWEKELNSNSLPFHLHDTH